MDLTTSDAYQNWNKAERGHVRKRPLNGLLCPEDGSNKAIGPFPELANDVHVASLPLELACFGAEAANLAIGSHEEPGSHNMAVY